MNKMIRTLVAATILVAATTFAPVATLAGEWTTVSMECPQADGMTTVVVNGHSRHGAQKAQQNALDEVAEHGYDAATCLVM